MIRLLSLLLIFAACSKQPENNKSSVLASDEQLEMMLDPMTAKILASGLSLDAPAIDFGAIPKKATATASISLTNSTLANQAVTLDHSTSAPVVASSNCPAQLLPRRGCTITLKIDSTPLAVASLINTSITLNGVLIPLSAVIAPEILVPSQIAVTPITALAFGEVQRMVTHKQRIQLLNSSLSNQSISIDWSELSKFSATSGCPLELKPRRTCFIELTLNTQELGMVSEDLIIEGEVYTLSGEIIERADETLNIVLSPATLNLGTFATPQVKQFTLTVNNKSLVDYSNFQLETGAPLVIKSSTCGASIKPRRSCSLILETTLNGSYPAGLNTKSLILTSGHLNSQSVSVIYTGAGTTPPVGNPSSYVRDFVANNAFLALEEMEMIDDVGETVPVSLSTEGLKFSAFYYSSFKLNNLSSMVGQSLAGKYIKLKLTYSSAVTRPTARMNDEEQDSNTYYIYTNDSLQKDSIVFESDFTTISDPIYIRNDNDYLLLSHVADHDVVISKLELIIMDQSEIFFPTMPTGLSVLFTESEMIVSWDAVPNAMMYLFAFAIYGDIDTIHNEMNMFARTTTANSISIPINFYDEENGYEYPSSGDSVQLKVGVETAAGRSPFSNYITVPVP